MDKDEERLTLGCLACLGLLFLFCTFTQPGNIIMGSIWRQFTSPAPEQPAGGASITSPVYEPAKSSDVLLFPKGTRDWKVVSTFRRCDRCTVIDPVIEYWCNFEGDTPDRWTRCYPATGTDT